MHEPKLNTAAEQFDRWMKKFEESHRKHGNLDNNNKALLNFLDGDSGFVYVKTYEELCELAVLLQEKGYKTTNPPCEPIDFARAIKNANPKSFGDSKPVIPDSVKKLLAAEQEQYKQKVDDYISCHVKEIKAIQDPEEQRAKSIALGLIAQRLFKDSRYQTTSRKNKASDTKQEQKRYQSPSLTHSGYNSD